MKKRRSKKPGSNRILFYVVAVLIVAALITGYRLWFCIIDVNPEFNYILITKKGNLLKLLDGETLQLHPLERIQILNISTNVCFNKGIRLVSSGMDVNALLYEEIQLSDLLPDRKILNKYSFRLNVKHYNKEIGYINIMVEPFVEDWLDKIDRTIDTEKKIQLLKQAKDLWIEDKKIKERLIKEYLNLERWTEVIPLLEEMFQETSDQAILYELLRAYEATSSVEDIISVLNRLIKINPNDIDLRIRLANLMEEQERNL